MRLTFSTLSRVLILIAFAICNVRAQEVVSRIDGYMNAAAQSGTFSGAILIAREGKVLINKGYGMASLELGVANTPEMKYRIGSLTKQFTAMAVLILQEHGRLNVQDSVCKYVSECPPDWAAITIHHLLTHTSGIPELLSLPEFQTTLALPSPVSRTVERFRNKPLEFRPGEKFKYSNSGYILLAYIIERITGQPYEDFLKDNIFEPLKMMNTGSDHNERIIKNRAAGYSKKGNEVVNAAYIDMSIPTGGGSLYSTTGDLFLWDQALYANKLITKKSSEIMFAKSIPDCEEGTSRKSVSSEFLLQPEKIASVKK